MNLTLLKNSHSICALLLAGGIAFAIPALAGSSGPEKAASATRVEKSTAPVLPFDGVTKAPARAQESALVSANFTVKGAEALVPVYTESFDNGLADWTVEPAGSVIEWSTKNLGGTKSFAEIVPGDAASLYVEGPYQVYKRAISTLTSGEIVVPASGVLSFYAGYSLNYNDVASLKLSLSIDDFETEETVWNSIEQEGERVWAWRYISIDVAELPGQPIRLRFTYGPGTADNFNTGGYLADFAIDGLQISGMQSVESVSVLTGEKIELVNISEGPVASLEWTMPGAVPANSTEANPTIYYTRDGIYDITLTVTDAQGATSSVTRSNFVTVTGTEPVARIIPPAIFRLSSNRKPLVAPLVPVKFRDGSSGFPTEHYWAFMHVTDDPNEVVSIEEENPEVSFTYLHDKTVALAVGNEHGASMDQTEVTAEYGGAVCNLEATDGATTFDMGDWGIFPGSNTRKITAYAERFSAPSRPVMVTGAYVFFDRADAEEVVDQIANVGVHLYTSENGLPGKRLDSFWWSVYELDLGTDGSLAGTAFPFTECPIVDGEFFIVVDGIPEFSETCAVSFAMAPFRDHGNTAYFLRDDKWTAASDYFPAGANNTSFLIFPQVYHSVMASLADDEHKTVTFGREGGTVDYPVFSYLGYETPVESDSEWLRAVGEPNDMTVDDIHVQCDPLPADLTFRRGKLTLTDGASYLEIPVEQSGESGVSTEIALPQTLTAFPAMFTDTVRIYGAAAGSLVSIHSTAGALLWQGTVPASGVLEVSAESFPRGVVVISSGSDAIKAVKK